MLSKIKKTKANETDEKLARDSRENSSRDIHSDRSAAMYIWDACLRWIIVFVIEGKTGLMGRKIMIGIVAKISQISVQTAEGQHELSVGFPLR